MSRLATLTKRAALAASALAAAAAIGGAATSAAQARTNDLAKPVIVVAGPEVPAGCGSLTPFEKVLRRAHVEASPGVFEDFTSTLHLVNINPKGVPCASWDATQLKADNLYDAALALAREISAVNQAEQKPVDVVAFGSAGPVLRYALTMAQRKRLGYKLEDEQVFAGNLDVEDAVVMGGVMDGLPYKPANCGSSGLCDDLVRPAEPEATKPIQWQLMDTTEGRNPQGIHGTDWTLISLAGDRFAPEATALGMDAAHRTAYDTPTLMLDKALTDTVGALNMSAHYAHAPSKVFVSSTKVAHPLGRIVQDIVWGTSVDQDSGGQGGAAYANGCTGYVAPAAGTIPPTGPIPDSTAATVTLDPVLANWPGDKRAVRVLKVGMLDAVATCFKQDPKDAGRFIAAGPQTVRVNGIDFLLKSSKAAIEFNVRSRTVKRISGATEMSVPLAESTGLYLKTFDDSSLVDLDLKFPASATDGAIQSDDGTVFSFVPPEFKLFGLKSTGAFTLRVVKGGFQIEGSLSMPAVFSSNLAGDGDAECGNLIDDDKDGKADAADTDCNGTTTGDFEDGSRKRGFAFAVGTTNGNGLQIDKFTASVGGELRFGPFRSSGSVGIEYLRRDNELKFQVEAALPAVSGVGAKLKVGFKNGQLNSIYAEANGLNIPLWTTQWYFQRLGIGASGMSDGQQAEILISTTISFLRKINGKYFMSVDGDLTVSWGAPWKVKLAGAFNFLDDRYGSGSMTLDQATGMKFDVLLGREIPIYKDAATGKAKVTLTPQGKLAGSVNLAGEMDIGASLQACVKGTIFGSEYREPWCLSKVDMRLTKFNAQPVQYSTCFRTNVFVSGSVSVGFVAKVREGASGPEVDFDWISHACDVADYGAKVAQVSGSGTDAFTVRAGEDRRVIEVRGEDGGDAPQVTLVAPDGTRYATPTDTMGQQLGADAYVVTGLGGKTAFVLSKPQLGQWKVETAEGSPKVTGIDVLNVLPEPKVSAHVVRGRGGSFALAHAVERQPGQSVRFVERSAGGVDHELARSAGGTGRTTFRPAFGPAGKRDVVALVLQDGTVRRELTVGSYVAPAPARAGRVRGITVRRSGERVTVTWSKAQRAGSYEVLVDLPDGRGEARIVPATHRRVVVSGLAAPGQIRVRVRALRAQDEQPGPAAHAHGTGLQRAASRGAHRR